MKGKFILAFVAFTSSRIARAADPALCPGSNGRTYTSSCGATWTIECDSDHSGGDLPVTAQYVASLQACIEICQGNSDCTDVSWILGSPMGPCYLKGEGVQGSHSDSGIWTGRKLSGCAAAQAAPVAATTTTQAPAAVQSTVQQVTTQVVVNNQPETQVAVTKTNVVATTAVVNNNPVAVTNANNAQQTTVIAGSLVTIQGSAGAVVTVANAGTTFLTQITSNPASSAELSVTPGSGAIISTAAGGSIVTIQNVGSLGTASAASSAARTTLTKSQNSTATKGASSSKTTTGEGSASSGSASTTKSSGLSKTAFIGLGAGAAVFVLLLFAALFWLRWHKKKRRNKKIIHEISAVGTTKGGIEAGDILLSRPHGKNMSELHSTSTAEMESPTSTHVGSLRSPVSPYGTINGVYVTAPGPRIYEMMGSEPAEMVGSPAPPKAFKDTPKFEESPAQAKSSESPTLNEKEKQTEKVEKETPSSNLPRRSSIIKTSTNEQSLDTGWKARTGDVGV